MRRFLDNYEDDPEEREMKVSDELEFMMNKSNIPAIFQILEDRLVNNYREVLLKDLEVLYNDIQHNLKRAVRESRALKGELMETAQADLSKRRKKVEENEKAYAEILKCQKQLQAYINDVDKKTENNLKKLLAAMDAPPNPQYKKEGTKLYKKALSKIKKITLSR